MNKKIKLKKFINKFGLFGLTEIFRFQTEPNRKPKFLKNSNRNPNRIEFGSV